MNREVRDPILLHLTPWIPVQIIICGWFLAGWSLILDSMVGESFEVNPALSLTPVYLRVILGLLLVGGSVAFLLSGLRWKNRSTQWRWELVAYPLLIPAWCLYTTSIFVINGLTLFPIALGLSHVAACVLRLIQVLNIVRSTRKNYEDLPEELKP